MANPLFTRTRMGNLDLPNRIVLAPLTRMRAGRHDQVPTMVQADYYAQRADAGLLVSEGIAVSPEGYGWSDTAGLWNDAQVRGWAQVTDAVHARGGKIVAQLWHTGSISHPSLRDGRPAMSASAVNPLQESVIHDARVPTETPGEMTVEDIRRTIGDYALAARNAMIAGFDGVQIQANYLYLIAQFLNAGTNLRTDAYGGDIERRSRILFEIVEAVLAEVSPERTGIKIGPMHEGGPFAANDETLPLMEYAIREINGYGLAHLLLMGAMADYTGTPLEGLEGDGMFRHFRPIFTGTLIANVDMTAERGARLIEEGTADLIAFGRPYIANPDLVDRIATGSPLAEIDWATVYAPGPAGYSDYARRPLTAEAPMALSV